MPTEPFRQVIAEALDPFHATGDKRTTAYEVDAILAALRSTYGPKFVLDLEGDKAKVWGLEQVGWLDKGEGHESWRHIDAGMPSRSYVHADWRPVHQVVERSEQETLCTDS